MTMTFYFQNDYHPRSNTEQMLGGREPQTAEQISLFFHENLQTNLGIFGIHPQILAIDVQFVSVLKKDAHRSTEPIR